MNQNELSGCHFRSLLVCFGTASHLIASRGAGRRRRGPEKDPPNLTKGREAKMTKVSRKKSIWGARMTKNFGFRDPNWAAEGHAGGST